MGQCSSLTLFTHNRNHQLDCYFMKIFTLNTRVTAFFYPLSRVMSTSKWPLKVSEERVQMYRARRNQHLAAAVTDGDHEPEVDPYAFEEGDVKFTFSNKKDKSGGEREPGKKHKVRPAKWRSEECSSAVSRIFIRLYCAL